MTQCKYYGIRHHGPGSAKALLSALQQQKPDCLLIELPADVFNLLKQSELSLYKPPVAILIYEAADPSKASFLPFAVFSPEWQAMTYAQQAGIPIIPIDLPFSNLFVLEPEASLLELNTDKTDLKWVADPLGYIAHMAGHEEVEEWWELYVETQNQYAQAFDFIHELMRDTRAQLNRIETRETLLREAHMRHAIREAAQKKYQNMAVVCGAWHVPAIENALHTKPQPDKQSLKGLHKTKTVATWSPWSYKRLSKESGYYAGVPAPVWYDVLFQKTDSATATMLSKAADILRRLGHSVSTADIIAAQQLATALSQMRGRHQAGMAELQEAADAIYTRYNPVVRQQLAQTWWVDATVGHLPKGSAIPPILQDLERQIKEARLTKFYQSGTVGERVLDLRKAPHQTTSRLLHRLRLLGIDWGRIITEEGRRLSVIERWAFTWEPEFLPQIIQAGAYGSTISEALINLMRDEITLINQIDQAVYALVQALQADLPEVVEPLTRQLQQLTLDEYVLDTLLDTVDWLVQLEKYGSLFMNIPSGLDLLRQELIMRILVRLPAQTHGINDDEAKEIARLIQQFVGTLALLNDPGTSDSWLDVLTHTVTQARAHPLLLGLMLRILYDARNLDQNAVLTTFKQQLSAGTPPKHIALWLQGFLYSGARILQYHNSLRQLLTHWLLSLDQDSLNNLLPLLRMATSTFSSGDKARLLNQIRNDQTQTTEETLENNSEKALPTDIYDFYRLLFSDTTQVL